MIAYTERRAQRDTSSVNRPVCRRARAKKLTKLLEHIRKRADALFHLSATKERQGEVHFCSDMTGTPCD